MCLMRRVSQRSGDSHCTALVHHKMSTVLHSLTWFVGCR
uniref:Uncharacterized protein n=1 Tax=Parascaris equorum TaxID=6256 RepID=A0A914S699_PAREQ